MTADLSGRICLVTGANRGIGQATAEGLAARGADVILVCRRVEDGEAAARQIVRKGLPQPGVVGADLSSQSSIRQAAAEIQARYPQLHVLINNAGIIPPRREVTVDGLEMQFAVNHLAYFLLAGAPSRIVSVSSAAHAHATIDFDDLQSERGYQPKDVYSRTKLANLLFTYELSRRLAGTGVTANALEPGIVATRMLDDYLGGPSTFGASPAEGAETSIYLASAPTLTGITGKYFARKKPVSSSRESYDEAAARRLWQVSERLTGLSS